MANTKEIYSFMFDTGNSFSQPLMSNTMTRLIDGNVTAMRFYPPEIVNTAKGYTETSNIDVSDKTNFINPAKANIAAFSNNLMNIHTLVTVTYPSGAPVSQIGAAAANVANTCVPEMLRHTERLTGQAPLGEPLNESYVPADGRKVPYLIPLNAIGKSKTYLSYVETGERDETLLNEAYGAIFFDYANLSSTLIEITNQIIANVGPETEPGVFYSYMDGAYGEYLANVVQDMRITIDQRRTDDENVFATVVGTLSGESGILTTIDNIQKDVISQVGSNAEKLNSLL